MNLLDVRRLVNTILVGVPILFVALFLVDLGAFGFITDDLVSGFWALAITMGLVMFGTYLAVSTLNTLNLIVAFGVSMVLSAQIERLVTYLFIDKWAMLTSFAEYIELLHPLALPVVLGGCYLVMERRKVLWARLRALRRP